MVSSRAFLLLPETPLVETATPRSQNTYGSSDEAPLHPPRFTESPHFDRENTPANTGTAFDGSEDVLAPSSPVAGSKRASSPTLQPSPPSKRSKGVEPKFREGFIPGRVPKAEDYEDVVKALIIRACLEYSARISSVNAFPSTADQIAWAKECWKAACRAANKNYQATDRVIKLVSSSTYLELFFTCYSF